MYILFKFSKAIFSHSKTIYRQQFACKVEYASKILHPTVKIVWCQVCRLIFLKNLSSPSSAQTPLVAAADLKKELETLQYREHKKLAFQGQITAVQYMKHPKTTGGTEEKEVIDTISKHLSKKCGHSNCRIRLIFSRWQMRVNKLHQTRTFIHQQLNRLWPPL